MSDYYIEMTLSKACDTPDALPEIDRANGFVIGQIYKIIIDKDNMTAIFINRHSYNKNKRLTGWEANNTLPKPLSFYSVFINTYDEDFAREFITTQPLLKKPNYYGEFLLKPNADNLQMKLTLLNRKQKGVFQIEESFAIANISEVSFCYGVFTVHFTSKKPFQRAKTLTDWPNAKGKFSLEMPIKKNIKSYSIEIM